MKIMFGTPCYGGVITTGYLRSFLATLKELRERNIISGWDLVTTDSESLVPRARNYCAKMFLDSDCDKLIFIDADIVWTPMMIMKLLASEHSLVGGSYPLKAFPMVVNFNPLPQHWTEVCSTNRGADYDKFKDYAAKYADGLGQVEVRHLPTGFMCIDRSLIESLRHWVPEYQSFQPETGVRSNYYDFFQIGVDGSAYRSEDWFFCDLVRAQGHKIYLNTQCITKHIGLHTYAMGQFFGEISSQGS